MEHNIITRNLQTQNWNQGKFWIYTLFVYIFWLKSWNEDVMLDSLIYPFNVYLVSTRLTAKKQDFLNSSFN